MLNVHGQTRVLVTETRLSRPFESLTKMRYAHHFEPMTQARTEHLRAFPICKIVKV
jgi:hypothetical protein